MIFLLLFSVENSDARQVIPPKPSPARFISDFSQILNKQEQSILERKLRAYHDSTSTQIAVVIISSLDDLSIEEFSAKLANSWGLGQKGKDNGLLILVSIKDRKVRMEAGYGIEPYLTDVVAKQIISNELNPAFRNTEYFEGLDKATNAVIKVLSGKFKPDNKSIFLTNIPRWVVYVLTVFFLITFPSMASKELWINAVLCVLILSVSIELFMGYYLQYSWSWVLTGITNFIVIFFWVKKTDTLEQKRGYLNRLKILSVETDWDDLKQKYTGYKIIESQQKLETAINELTEKDDIQEIRKIHSHYLNILNPPYEFRYFGFREDEKLVDFYNKTRQEIATNECYKAHSRLEFTKKLEKESNLFQALNFKRAFNNEEKQKLKTVVNEFSPIIKSPHRYLELNFKDFLKKIDKDFKLILKEQPTLISKEIEKKWRKIKKLNFQISKNKEALITFYESIILVNLLKVKWNKQIKNTSSYTYKSQSKKHKYLPNKSNGSYSDFDYTSDSRGSDIEFGGGEFGGGGATGEW